MTTLLAELRRRNVLKVAAAYAVVGWIFIEAGSVLLPTFGAPEWVFQAYVLLVIAGFLFALAFAWVFELTPEGLKREKDVDRSVSVTDETGRKLNFVIIGLLIIALVISITLNVTGMRPSETTGETMAGGKSIAVLPFTSRSADQENVFFADGIHDDLLTTLANIGSLKVISRTSVMEYRDTTKNLRQIGSELGVATVLEGSVQRVGDNVRINVQLIDAATDEHLWAEIYDRELTTQSVFAIQSDISQAIAKELKATLTVEEQKRLNAVETESLEAYSFYLAGRNNLDQRRLENLRQARKQFERAIELDPEYAQAYSGLSDSLMLIFTNHRAISPEEAFPIAQAALDRALELETEDADIYASLGLFKMEFWEQSRMESALDEAAAAFERAIELNPNHAQAHSWYASVYGMRGQPEKSVELLEQSIELDPLARIPQTNLGVQYAQLGRNDDAVAQWIRAAELHPDWPTPYDNLATHLAALGRLDEAVAYFERARELSTDPLTATGLISIYIEFGYDEKIREFLDSIPEGHPLSPIVGAFAKVIEGDDKEALEILERVMKQTENPGIFILSFAADTAMVAGEFEKSRKYYELLWPQFADGAKLEINAVNDDDVIAYAYVLRNLGETERATMLLEGVMAFFEDRPRLGMAGYGVRDVETLVLLGRTEDALAALREAVDVGWRSTAIQDNWQLENDPFLYSIQDRPEFVAIAAEVRTDIDRMRERVVQAEATGNWDELLAAAKEVPSGNP